MEFLGRAATLLGIVAVVGTLAFVAASFAYAEAVGWRAFAKRYPVRAAPAAARYHVEALVFGEQGWYLPAMMLDVGPRGIALVPGRLFRPFFPPAQIPPEAILGAERGRSAFFDVLRIQVGRSPATLVGFPPSEALEAIQKRLLVPIRDATLTRS